MLKRLDERFIEGGLELVEYASEWDALLRLAGWTDEEYGEEMERRWDVAPLRRPVSNNLFRC